MRHAVCSQQRNFLFTRKASFQCDLMTPDASAKLNGWKGYPSSNWNMRQPSTVRSVSTLCWIFSSTNSTAFHYSLPRETTLQTIRSTFKRCSAFSRVRLSLTRPSCSLGELSAWAHSNGPFLISDWLEGSDLDVGLLTRLSVRGQKRISKRSIAWSRMRIEILASSSPRILEESRQWRKQCHMPLFTYPLLDTRRRCLN